jgi:two-component system response regulator HydG
VNTPRILVADDDASLRAALRGSLEARGCAVTEAADGAEALDAVASALDGRTPRPDVVVLDVRMPRMSGLGVLGVLRGLGFRISTFVITGLSDPSIDVVVARLGGARVFRKPLDLNDLAAAVLDAATG